MIKKIIPVILLVFTLYAQQSPLDQNQFMLAESYVQKGDFSKAVEIIEIEAEEDVSPINIIFNAKFLIDALRYIEADKVTFCMNGEVSPTLLYNSEYHFGDKDEYPSYLCMIMPIKPQAN